MTYIGDIYSAVAESATAVLADPDLDLDLTADLLLLTVAA